MKKRILAAMMAAVMVFSMAGCGSKADERQTTQQKQKQLTTKSVMKKKQRSGIYCSQLKECNG